MPRGGAVNGLALAGALALAPWGCANSSASTATELHATVEPAPKPQQVVQRIEPAPPSEPPPAAGAAGQTGNTAVARPTAKRPTAAITTKHIEDELNRLEAELK
jgi:hypothetical protein